MKLILVLLPVFIAVAFFIRLRSIQKSRDYREENSSHPTGRPISPPLTPIDKTSDFGPDIEMNYDHSNPSAHNHSDHNREHGSQSHGHPNHPSHSSDTHDHASGHSTDFGTSDFGGPESGGSDHH